LGLLQPPALTGGQQNSTVNPLGLRAAEIDELLQLPPAALLLRWLNFHLTTAVGAAASASGADSKSLRQLAPKALISNFSSDTKDCTAILIVVRHLVHLKRQSNVRQTAVASPPSSADSPNKRSSVIMSPLPALSAVPSTNATHALELAANELNVNGFIDPIDIVSGHSGLTILFVAALFSMTSTLGLRKRRVPGSATTPTAAAGASSPPVSGESASKSGVAAGKEPMSPSSAALISANTPRGTRLSIGGMPAPLLSRPSISATAAASSTVSPQFNRANRASMGRISFSALNQPLASQNSKDAEWEDDDDMGRVLKQLRAHDTTTDDDREERAFRNWINACGIPGINVHNLFADLRDGLVLLRVFDHIEPVIVDWSKVEKKPSNKFKAVGNCNHALAVGRRLKFSLVGIDGSNVFEGHRTFTLALVWQMMRYHTIKYLQSLYSKRYGYRQISDAQIIVWANNRVSKAVHPFLKALKVVPMMSSFKDANLSNSLFVLNLLSNVSAADSTSSAGTAASTTPAPTTTATTTAMPTSSSGAGGSAVNWSLVTPGSTPEERLLNARYAISVARKLGATIFLSPEDIIEGKPKMLMTFFGSIMAFDSAAN
jgi:hypothetical protein